MSNSNELNLEVPDIETDISSLQDSNTNKKEQGIDNNTVENKEEEMFIKDDSSEIEISPLEDISIDSSSNITREQITKDSVRTIFVNEEDSLKYPCTIIDLTNAKNLSISLLNQLKTLVYTRDDIHEKCVDNLDLINDMINNLETSVYTKYGSKVVHIGYINKNDTLRIIIKILIQANIGEQGKNFNVLYAGESGKFKSMNEHNCCDLVHL